MPARDLLHPIARRALERDGWTVTDDPLVLKVGRRSLFVDLGAERLLIASRDSTKIAVEVKSFSGPSELADLETALGQFVLYERVLRGQDPERSLWLAIPETTWSGLFQEAIGDLLLNDANFRLLVIDTELERIRLWVPSTPGVT